MWGSYEQSINLLRRLRCEYYEASDTRALEAIDRAIAGILEAINKEVSLYESRIMDTNINKTNDDGEFI